MGNNLPDFILYAQHGWADNSQKISFLAQTLSTSETKIIAPDLGWLQTWISIKPLIEKVEKIALKTMADYPHTPRRIIGHSLGGLIWLEVLQKHPEWWLKIESLVLIGSPIGGADLARIIDPLGFGIGIAKDLGINRRQLAETIAKVIPTLIIAGDIDEGSDGTITVQSTKFSNAKFVCLPKLSHASLKKHPLVASTIQDFWDNPKCQLKKSDFITLLIERLQLVIGITDAHPRDFEKAQILLTFKNGVTIRIWKNPLQVTHIFVADAKEKCVYSGFVGWLHTENLLQTIQQIKTDLKADIYL